MKGIWVNFIDPDLFFQFLKRHSHGNRFFNKIGEITFIQHADIPKAI